MPVQVHRSIINVSAKDPSNVITASGKMNGRTIVQIDSSYAKKHDFRAGVGPEMLDGLGTAMVLMAMLLAIVVAAISVGAATLSLTTVAITVGVLTGVTALVTLVMRVSCPKF